MFDMTT